VYAPLSTEERGSDGRGGRKNRLCAEALGMRQQHLKYLLDHLALPASSNLRQIRLRAGKGRRFFESGWAVLARQACYMVARTPTVVNVSIP
jgi:hypothetical protein